MSFQITNLFIFVFVVVFDYSKKKSTFRDSIFLKKIKHTKKNTAEIKSQKKFAVKSGTIAEVAKTEGKLHQIACVQVFLPSQLHFFIQSKRKRVFCVSSQMQGSECMKFSKQISRNFVPKLIIKNFQL